MKGKKKAAAAVMMAAVTIGLCGCQKNPNSSLVVHKDMDKLIEQAGNTQAGEDITQMSEKYESYKASLEDDSLGVKVNVDAKVDIPNTKQMSVIRVKQKEITQDLFDTVRKNLMSEGQNVYDGGVMWVKTKESIEEEIRSLKQQIKDAQENPDYGGDSAEWIQDSINQLQQEYENAPAKIEWDKYVSDGKIASVKEKNDSGQLQEFYSWAYSCNPNGEVCYLVTDGSNGYKEALYTQNNKNYGNCIRYTRSKNVYGRVFSADVSGMDLNVNSGGNGVKIWRADLDTIPEALLSGTDASEWKETDDTLTISAEDAMRQADELLKKIGITDFTCSENVRSCREDGNDADGSYLYRKEYFLRYVRTIDGALLNYDTEGKFKDGQKSDGYLKREWTNECIEIEINDDGIVGFSYLSPLELAETVVDKSSMKSFDEIKEIFEKMVMVANASDTFDPNDGEEAQYVKLDVDRAALEYIRISEENSFDTGLLVPAWDFRGTRNAGLSEKEDMGYRSILAINAIDGSVIDRKLGY